VPRCRNDENAKTPRCPGWTDREAGGPSSTRLSDASVRGGTRQALTNPSLRLAASNAGEALRRGDRSGCPSWAQTALRRPSKKSRKVQIRHPVTADSPNLRLTASNADEALKQTQGRDPQRQTDPQELTHRTPAGTGLPDEDGGDRPGKKVLVGYAQ